MKLFLLLSVLCGINFQVYAQGGGHSKSATNTDASASNEAETTTVYKGDPKYAKFLELLKKKRFRKEAEKDFQTVKELHRELEKHAKETLIPLNVRGNLTEEGLKEWLKNQQLVNKNLFIPGCLDVRQKFIEGLAVDQLFFVLYDPVCLGLQPVEWQKKQLLMIIKRIKGAVAEKEIAYLNRMRHNPKLRQIFSVRNPNYPQLAFPEHFYWFPIGTHYMGAIALIHAAKGISLYDYISTPTGFERNPDQALAAFKKLGEVLANFQLRFMEGDNCSLVGGTDINTCKTIVHGDIHPKNIFYDGQFIYWIDLETMQDKPQFFIKDLSYLYGLPMLKWQFFRDPLKFRNYKKAYKAFLDAYLAQIAKDPHVRDQVRIALQNAIRDYINKWGTRGQRARYYGEEPSLGSSSYYKPQETVSL